MPSKLNNFQTETTVSQQYFQVVNSQANEKNYEWGLGQAGISSHIVTNLNRTQREVLIGAPGARLWSGNNYTIHSVHTIKKNIVSFNLNF